MRHKKGNSPKCSECFFYSEKKEGENNRFDGWCTCPRQLNYGINGRKRETPLEKMPVRAQGECTWWEDAEDRTSHYEVTTGRKPE